MGHTSGQAQALLSAYLSAACSPDPSRVSGEGFFQKVVYLSGFSKEKSPSLCMFLSLFPHSEREREKERASGVGVEVGGGDF